MAKKQIKADGASSASASSPSASTRARPLPRGPHTVQLVFHLVIHALLLLLTTIVLPSHLLTRSSEDESISSLSFLGSTRHFFEIPYTPANESQLAKCMWGGVQGVVLIQGWALMRLRKWYELGDAIRNGDRKVAEEVNKRGWAKSAEMLTLSSVSLPGAFALIHTLAILIGSPVSSNVKATAQFSLAVMLLIAFPLLHVLPGNMDLWTRLLGCASPQSAQERVMLLTTVLPLITSFLASAALTFDHGLAWSGTYPVASLMGLFVGCIAADLIAIPVYLVGDK